ncbi:hypothetical protein CHK_1820 [Christensenella hongkongensis]|uniref:Uncharacterized protein n=1 Tax=Christensenella hongkongensis TaxID=270498 RepID=A0A0M2NKD1_9FIRM|nr:hypothetical protein CHK_1820 [Christensenella hongkongensis]
MKFNITAFFTEYQKARTSPGLLIWFYQIFTIVPADNSQRFLL